MGFDLVRTTLPNLAADVKNAIVGGPFGSNLVSKDYSEFGVPVIRGQNMGRGKYIAGDFVYVSEDKAQSLNANKARPGDIVFTQRGTLGQVAIVPPEPWKTYIVSQSQMKVTIDQKKANVEFLYYYFSSPKEIQYMLSNAIQTGVPHTNLTQLRKHPIWLPPLHIQEAIAHILGTLDDKIELNRQINATLEAMAQALFKSWFVDFDPVIDNALAAGNPIPEPLQARAEARKALGDKRKPLPEEIRKQLPSSFVLTEEMGWVPEGWEVSTVGDEIGNTGGGTPSTRDPSYWEEGEYAFCTPKDMSALDSIVLTDTERHLTEAGVGKISSGQLPRGVVLMSSRAPIGYLAISDIPVSINQGIIAMLPNNKYSSTYLLNWAYFNMSAIKDRANGSTFLEISKKNFRPIPFLVPNELLVGSFNKQSQSLYDKLLLVSEQIRELTVIRDTLLPKLLSGQLRIPEVENQLAEAL